VRKVSDVATKKPKGKGAAKVAPGWDSPPTAEMLASGIESSYWERFEEIQAGDGDALIWALDVALRNIELGAIVQEKTAGMDPETKALVFQDYDFTKYDFLQFPAWLAIALRKHLVRYTAFDVRTLDDAFGLSRKSVNLAAKKRELEKFDLVTGEVYLRAEAGVPIDGELFEAIATRHNTNRQLVSEWWSRSRGRRVRRTVQEFAPIHKTITVDQLPEALKIIARKLLKT
jgi:hypothetical protein